MRRTSNTLSGAQLVADYQTAFIAIATSKAAQYQAEQSENELLQQLSYWSRGGFLQPGTIDSSQQPDVSRASLDAHIKKIQAHQVEQMKSAQLQAIGEANLGAYIGKKVRVEALSNTTTPFDVLWFSPDAGYRSNPLRKKYITGVIQELWLDKNILLIKPPLGSRMLNHDLTAYVVYVIDPDTAEPLISLNFV